MANSDRVPDFYLASSETLGLEDPRRCWREREVLLEGGNRPLLLVRIEPNLVGSNFNLSFDPNEVLLAPRHSRGRLETNHWPVYVHVAVFIGTGSGLGRSVSLANVEHIAWGELYPSQREAEERRMF